MKKLIYSMAVFSLVLSMMGCSSNQSAIQGKGETAAAYTMVAILTQSAFETVSAKLTEVSSLVTTPQPQQTGTPQPEQTPQASASPAATVSASTSSTGGAASAFSPAAGSPCNWAGFIKDVTYPDGTGIDPNKKFTKVWRLKNIGTCAWNTSYKLIYIGGDVMQANKEIPFSVAVPVGGTIDLSIDMIAPETPGPHISYWKLKSDQNVPFGIGDKADGIFYVKIRVGSTDNLNANVTYYLASNACDASWYTTKGGVVCPGQTNINSGSITKLSSVVIEGGITQNIPAIITVPNSDSGGTITGLFPARQVQSGDHFKTTIGCENGYPKCDVIFSISYKSDDGSVHSLASWGQTQDGYNHPVDIDLSSEVGNSIQMILSVSNNGSSEDDYAYWLNPIVGP
jgi:hypothetical protein